MTWSGNQVRVHDPTHASPYRVRDETTSISAGQNS
jgi:hypothetical protein